MGGAIGAVLRFLLSKHVQKLSGVEFPFGTLVVNLSSALLIGFFFSYLVEGMNLKPSMRALLITGLLGGYSTYSTLFWEAYYMLINGELYRFLFYLSLSNLLGILFVWLGYSLGRVL